MTRIAWVVDNRVFAADRRDPPDRRAGSWAFFCPKCCRVWGRVRVSGSPHYSAFHQPCTVCGDLHEVAGSILMSWDPGYEDAMPTELWEREIILTAEHIEKGGMLTWL